MATDTALSTAEAARLQSLEKVIDAGQKAFVEVGNALLSIRDAKLYRTDHKTFSDYCKARWEMTDRRAYQLINAATTNENLNNCSEKPKTESQSRPLTGLSPEEQKEAWVEVVTTAPKDKAGKPKVTAAHVEKVVATRVADAPSKDAATPTEEILSEPWQQYNEMCAEVVASALELKSRIEAVHATPFGMWIDLKQWQTSCDNFVATFKNYLVARWATKAEEKVIGQGRNFLHVVDVNRLNRKKKARK